MRIKRATPQVRQAVGWGLRAETRMRTTTRMGKDEVVDFTDEVAEYW